MPEPITALVAGGAILGGGILSHQGAMAQRGAMGRASAAMLRRLQELSDEYEQDHGQIVDQFEGMSLESIAGFTENWQSITDQIGGMYDNVVSQFGGMMDDVFDQAAVGRDATLASIDQATEANVRRQTASNQLTGLGNTTFGQSAIGAERQAGALRRGVVEEQYAQQLAAIRQAQAQGTTSLLQSQIGTTAAMGTEYSSRLAGMEQGFAGNLAQMQVGGLNQSSQMIMQGVIPNYQAQMQMAMMPTGWHAASGILSGIGGGLAMYGAGAAGAAGGAVA